VHGACDRHALSLSAGQVPDRRVPVYADAVITGSTGNVSITEGFFAVTVSMSDFCWEGSKPALVCATIRVPSRWNSSRAPAVTAAVKSESSCQTRTAVW
jgi:hypothetical protein